MIHVFTIHSHITFLAALGAIASEQLDTKKVILICGGSYQPKISNQFKGKIVDSFDISTSKKSIWQRLKQFNFTVACNEYIEKITEGDSFIAYIDLMSVFNRYLVMHPNCSAFHIIEEGIVNYADFDDFNLWTADLKKFSWQWTGLKNWRQMLNGIVRLLRGRSIKLLAMPIHPNLYTLHKNVNAYCFSEMAFSYTPLSQKKILTFSSVLPYIKNEEFSIPNDSWIWIGDTLCLANKVSMNHFENAIYKLLNEVNPRKNQYVIYLKFRGPESQIEKELTLQALKQFNFQIEYLDANRIMELEFLKGKNFKVLGIGSSLLIYANLMSHKTFSMFKYIPDIYQASISTSYQTISKKVGFLS